jgi:hypothetical protein
MDRICPLGRMLAVPPPRRETCLPGMVLVRVTVLAPVLPGVFGLLEPGVFGLDAELFRPVVPGLLVLLVPVVRVLGRAPVLVPVLVPVVCEAVPVLPGLAPELE